MSDAWLSTPAAADGSVLAALKHCREIVLQHVDDAMDGSLTIAEHARHIPFPIERVYFITRLSNPDAVRGKHAHRTLHQALFCINGSFELELDDGVTRARVVLDQPHRGVYLGPGLWHVMRRFSPECVILVLASARYDESDYLRSYDAFRQHLAVTERETPGA